MLAIAGVTQASENVPVKVIEVFDSSNEALAGVKIELVGTGKSFYTGISGKANIPLNLLQQAEYVKVDYISYKSLKLNISELNSKIILVNR